MSSRDYDHRSSPHDGQDAEPSDRRGSCRYPVAEAPAVLSWWETGESKREPATTILEAVRLGAVQRPKLFDMETYAAIMGRGPMLKGGFHTTRAQAQAQAQAAARPAPRNGQAGLPALVNGKADTAPSPKAHAALPAVREKPESRGEPQASGEPKMQSCRANILDISHTGISMISEDGPPEGQSVWVRLDDPTPSDWVEGTLAGVSRREAGRYLVRIRFLQACPYDFFKATVYRSPEK